MFLKIGAVNNFKNDLCDEIRLISSDGFDFVDLTMEPIFSHEIDLDEVKKTIDETGLEVIGHTSPFLPIIFPLKAVRQAGMQEMRMYVDYFHHLGVKYMNVHPSLNSSLMSEKDVFEGNREFISGINEYCVSKGITLMVESVTSPFNTPESFEKLLKGLDDIKVHLDVGHCNINTDRNLVEEFFSVFGERIVHVHFSDNMGDKDNHLPLGCGSIDWYEVVDILKKYDYKRTITLEVFTQDRRYLLESKSFIEEIINK
ncbi:MAG: sugar phosphate isomerase/epimerase family protein [Elusimicrobiota bacterium]